MDARSGEATPSAKPTVKPTEPPIDSTATQSAEPVPTTATTAPSEQRWLSLTGDEAKQFQLPEGLKVAWQEDDPKFGLTRTRYQQVIQGAEVRGGQITVSRNQAGEQTLVAGAYYPDLTPVNTVKLSTTQACAIVASSVEDLGGCEAKLGIDPQTGRFYYEVSIPAESIIQASFTSLMLSHYRLDKLRLSSL